MTTLRSAPRFVLDDPGGSDPDDPLVLSPDVGNILDRWGVLVDDSETYDGAIIVPRWAAFLYDVWADARESATPPPAVLAFVKRANRDREVRRAFLSVALLGSRSAALDYAKALGETAASARKE